MWYEITEEPEPGTEGDDSDDTGTEEGTSE
jgi:hypothetical protein